MAGKGKPFKRPKGKQVIFGRHLWAIVDFVNAFLNGEIVNGSSNEIIVSDKKIILKLKNSSNGTSSTPAQSYFRGIYVSGQTYNAMEWVVVQSGTASGAYISTADSNTNAPITGINWIQFSATPQWF